MMHTTINGIATVSIQSIKAQYTDPAEVTELVVKIQYDNLLDTCVLHWTLMYPIITTDIITNTDPITGEVSISTIDTTNYYESISGHITITGDNYTNWNGDNDYPFTFVATKLGLIITS